MKKLTVHVWSDVVCPWCYIGKRRLEAALARFEHRDAVEVVWHSFELDPSAPATRTSGRHAEHLAKKYGMSIAQAEAAIQRVSETAAADGLAFRFDRMQGGNTFDAHRLIHFAAARGRQDAMKERLLRAHFTDGEAVSDPATLARLAGEIGLDVEEATAALASDAYAVDVREDEAAAAQLGISGVPFFVIAERFGVSGAQPVETLLGALERAYHERAPADAAANEGAACGPAGCD